MKMKFGRVASTLCALALIAFKEASAFAQCAMCKASVQAQANASLDPQAAAQTFNLAVLVLLIPPVVLFVGLFLLLLRYRKGAERVGFKTAGAFD
jgi:hypothetical protein